MARRSEMNSAVSAYKGRYFRNIGKILNANGQVLQKKFLLGTDRERAEIANRLLESLWNCVLAEHKAAECLIRQMHGRLGEYEPAHRGRRMRRVDQGPIWRAESLAIAEIIRKGERQIVVQIGDDAPRPERYVERIANLRTQFDVIVFVSESPDLYAAGQAELTAEAQQTADDSAVEIQRLSSLAQAPLPVVSGQTLYQALEAYATFARLKNSKEHGDHEAASARRLKRSLPNIPLLSFGISAMEAMASYWATRPLSQNSGKPVAFALFPC